MKGQFNLDNHVYVTNNNNTNTMHVNNDMRGQVHLNKSMQEPVNRINITNSSTIFAAFSESSTIDDVELDAIFQDVAEQEAAGNKTGSDAFLNSVDLNVSTTFNEISVERAATVGLFLGDCEEQKNTLKI